MNLQKCARDSLPLAKVAKFRQIWSLLSVPLSYLDGCNSTQIVFAFEIADLSKLSGASKLMT